MDFLYDSDFTEEQIINIEDAIYDYVEADDCEEFEYTIQTPVGFSVENDGIGSYEFWGHTEYDRGHDYPVADELGEITSPPGTEPVVLTSDDDINEKLSEEADRHGLTWEDEDGGGSYSEFDIGIRYTFKVVNPEVFLRWVEENVNTTTANESINSDDGDNDDDNVEYNEFGEKIIKDGWKGRGADIEWRYQDVLKHVKSFNAIHDAVEKILYKLIWDMQTSDGERKAKAFEAAREELEIIRKESGRWAANKYLPGYLELMDDLKRIS